VRAFPRLFPTFSRPAAVAISSSATVRFFLLTTPPVYAVRHHSLFTIVKYITSSILQLSVGAEDETTNPFYRAVHNNDTWAPLIVKPFVDPKRNRAWQALPPPLDPGVELARSFEGEEKAWQTINGKLRQRCAACDREKEDIPEWVGTKKTFSACAKWCVSFSPFLSSFPLS
jgi:hypothetical protein